MNLRVTVIGIVALLAAGCSPAEEAQPASSRSAPLEPSVEASGPAERFAAAFGAAYPEHAPEATAVREFTLRAAPAQVEVGGLPLETWAYNGQVPGPILRMRLGETLRVTLDNALSQSTTIHWHGVRVPNAMDGVPGVTQPPVEPGGRFVYEFTPKDAGTFWFHPHLRASEQVERGLAAVLVVEDAEPLPYDQDVVWVLDDWLIGRDAQIHPQFNTPHDLSHDGRWGNLVTVNGRSDTVLEARPGERIRLRLVNTANGRIFRPSLPPGLTAQIVAVDGMYAAKPIPYEGFELAPGNRIDLDIVVAPELRGQTLAVRDRFTRQPFELASIRVLDQPPVPTPAFPSPAAAALPDWSEALALEPDLTYVLDARRGGELGIEWTLNGKAHGHDAPQRLAHGRFTRVRFANASYRLHPMHLHGQFFKVLARDGRPVDEPHWRDTVLVHPRETVDVALVALDDGPWMLHCHILEHAEAGMMTMIEVVREETPGGGGAVQHH